MTPEVEQSSSEKCQEQKPEFTGVRAREQGKHAQAQGTGTGHVTPTTLRNAAER